MTRRILTPFAAALLAAAAVVGGQAIAAGKGTKTQKIQGVAQAHAVNGGQIAGTIKDKYLGAGAVVYKDAALGTGVKLPVTVFARNGSYKGTATADVLANPDGTLTITNCTLKFTGGGGAYKGATGKGTCDGSADKDFYFTVNYKGNVKVPK
jgi:hypothetical protein